MARVKTRVASKDYPSEGIKKGDTYYTWTLYRQPKRRSLTYPKRSLLTSSAPLATFYDAFDDLPAEPTANDVRDVAEALGDARDEFQEQYDNLPDSFQQGERGQNIESAISAIEDAIASLESLADEVEDETCDDYWDDEDDDNMNHSPRRIQNHEAVASAVSDLEPDLGL